MEESEAVHYIPPSGFRKASIQAFTDGKSWIIVATDDRGLVTEDVVRAVPLTILQSISYECQCPASRNPGSR